MAVSEDDRPAKKPLAHQIGEDLAPLSLDDLAERVRLLKVEIGRLESAIAGKRLSMDKAEGFFKSSRLNDAP